MFLSILLFVVPTHLFLSSSIKWEKYIYFKNNKLCDLKKWSHGRAVWMVLMERGDVAVLVDDGWKNLLLKEEPPSLLEKLCLLYRISFKIYNKHYCISSAIIKCFKCFPVDGKIVAVLVRGGDIFKVLNKCWNDKKLWCVLQTCIHWQNCIDVLWLVGFILYNQSKVVFKTIQWNTTLPLPLAGCAGRWVQLSKIIFSLWLLDLSHIHIKCTKALFNHLYLLQRVAFSYIRDIQKEAYISSSSFGLSSTTIWTSHATFYLCYWLVLVSWSNISIAMIIYNYFLCKYDK